MVYQEFLIGELFVRAELVGAAEDLPKLGPVLPVKVYVGTQELFDAGKGVVASIEKTFSGNLDEDLKQAAYSFLQDLCEMRRDPAGYRERFKKERSRNIKRRGAPVPPEKRLMAANEYLNRIDEWQKILGADLDEGCLVMELERSWKRSPSSEPPAISGLEMSNGRWRPERAKLSEVLPTEAIEELVPIMNRVQQGDLDLVTAQREIFDVINPHRKLLDELQIDVPNFAFKIAYFARGHEGGLLGDVTLIEIESPKN